MTQTKLSHQFKLDPEIKILVKAVLRYHTYSHETDEISALNSVWCEEIPSSFCSEFTVMEQTTMPPARRITKIGKTKIAKKQQKLNKKRANLHNNLQRATEKYISKFILAKKQHDFLTSFFLLLVIHSIAERTQS